MSQFQTPFEEESTGNAKTSGLAITSLVCSLIICCPITTIIGPILGLVALVTIGSNPQKKGKGIAIVAVLIGLIVTLVWAVVGYQFYGKIIKPFMETMMTGPDSALTAGYAGDTAGFKAKFYGDGAIAPDEEAAAFIESLRERYGEFQLVVPDETAQMQPAYGEPIFPMAYLATFDNGTVDAEVTIIIVDEVTGQLVMKLGTFTIFDSELGDLQYPLGP